MFLTVLNFLKAWLFSREGFMLVVVRVNLFLLGIQLKKYYTNTLKWHSLIRKVKRKTKILYVLYNKCRCEKIIFLKRIFGTNNISKKNIQATKNEDKKIFVGLNQGFSYRSREERTTFENLKYCFIKQGVICH